MARTCREGRGSGGCNGGLRVQNALVFIQELLALLCKLGLKNLFFRDPGLVLTLEPLKVGLAGRGGIKTFLGEGGGFSGEGLVDPLLDGVDLLLGLGVMGIHSGGVEATLVDESSQVGGGSGVSDLIPYEWSRWAVSFHVELVIEAAITEIAHDVSVRRADVGPDVGDHGGEVVGEGVADASATGATVDDGGHVVGDEGVQGLLPEPREVGELERFSDGLEAFQGTVGEQGVLGVGSRHADVKLSDKM